MCNSFFQRVKRWTYVNFLTDNFLGSVIPFTHDDNQCSILQFYSQDIMLDVTQKDLELSAFGCHAYLVAEIYSVSGSHCSK